MDLDIKKALEKILDYVNLDEYDYVTSGVLDAEQLLIKALTQPTEEEVCKAYANQYHCGLLYNRKLNEFVEIKGGRSRGKIIARKVGECLEFPHPIHSQLLTMIGKFYEGLE